MKNHKNLSFRRSSTIVLQIVVVAIGIAALALFLWEPWLEGVNASATTFSQIYFDDPFLILVYAGAIPFFIALYQVFKLLGFIGRNEIFSEKAVKVLRTIKHCAMVIIGFVAIEELFILLNRGNDDAAGGVFMGLLIVVGSGVVTIAATVFERILQRAVDIKFENDLTV